MQLTCKIYTFTNVLQKNNAVGHVIINLSSGRTCQHEKEMKEIKVSECLVASSVSVNSWHAFVLDSMTRVHRVQTGRGHMLVKPFASTSPLTSDFGLRSTNPLPCVALKVVVSRLAGGTAGWRSTYVSSAYVFFFDIDDSNATFSRENTGKPNRKSSQTSEQFSSSSKHWLQSTRNGFSTCKCKAVNSKPMAKWEANGNQTFCVWDQNKELQ